MKLQAIRTNFIWNNILLFVVSFTFLIVWLPLIRSIFDGPSYVWGTTLFGIPISGAGLSPSLLFVFFQFVFYIFLFFSFYWFANRAVFRTLIISWFVMVFGNFFYDIAVNGDTMFHGDTMDVHFSLLSIVLPLGIIAALLTAYVIYRDSRHDNVAIGWSKKNSLIAAIIYGPLPIQAILFATGEPHDLGDQIGVVIAIAQAFLTPLIVRPYKKKTV